MKRFHTDRSKHKWIGVDFQLSLFARDDAPGWSKPKSVADVNEGCAKKQSTVYNVTQAGERPKMHYSPVIQSIH